MPECVGRDCIGVIPADSIDLRAAQPSPAAADEQIGTVLVGAFQQVFLYRVFPPFPLRTVISLAGRDTSPGLRAKHSLIRRPA